MAAAPADRAGTLLSPGAGWRTHAADLGLLLAGLKAWPALAASVVGFALLTALAEGLALAALLPIFFGLGAPAAGRASVLQAFWTATLGRLGVGPADQVAVLVGIVLFAAVARACAAYASAHQASVVEARLLGALRLRIFDRLMAAAPGYHDQTSTARLQDVLAGQLSAVGLVARAIGMGLSNALTLPAYALLLLALSWRLTAAAAIAVLVIIALLAPLTTRIRRQSADWAAANRLHATRLAEWLAGIRLITLSAAVEPERRRYEAVCDDQGRTAIAAADAAALRAASGELLGTAGLLGLMALGLTTLDVAFPALMAFIVVAMRALPAFRNVLNSSTVIALYAGPLGQVMALVRVDEESRFVDGERPYPGLARELTFEDVAFAYRPGEPVLDGVSFTLVKGSFTAIVGASGAGKSTIAHLLLRLYEPGRGRILVDGVPLSAFRVAELRQRVAVVTQETFLFDASVRENIVFGSAKAHTDEAVLAACEAAGARVFVEALPEGLDTHVGERGVRLSAGERQRLAIARALLRDPELLILDEATSALDQATERSVQGAIERLAEGRTVLAIAHRLSTVERADRVLVLAEGRIAEEGPPAALLDRRGLFWALKAEGPA